MSFFLLMVEAASGQLAQGEKDTVFVGGLKVKPSVVTFAEKQGNKDELQRVAESLDTQFINALNATRVFQLVDRKRIGDLEAEQAFAAIAVDPNDKNAAKQFKMAGAKFAFLPQIDSFEIRTQTDQYQQIGRTSMNRKVFLSALVQIIDTTTGKLLPDAPSIQINKSEDVEQAKAGQATWSEQTLVALAKEMANKLSQGVVGLLRPAKVLDVTGNQVLINRGTEAGFVKGSLVEICAFKEVKDDDTGETFRNEIPVGRVKITRADAKQSNAVIEGENMGIAKGCVARVVSPTEAAGSDATGPATPAPESKPVQYDAEKKVRPIPAGSDEKPLKFE
jgi:curli biogenesis system outer membrane secretion channel CsgG